MTPLRRPVVRVTSTYDYRTRKPYVVRLEQGGELVRIKIFGGRSWLTVTIKQLWQLACETKAKIERAEKRRLKELLKKERQAAGRR